MSDTPRTDRIENFDLDCCRQTCRTLERELAVAIAHRDEWKALYADVRKASDQWAAQALNQRELLEQAICHVKAQLWREQHEPPFQARRTSMDLHNAICDALAAQRPD